MATKKKSYVVWEGRICGIFDNWEDCKAQVFGFEELNIRHLNPESKRKLLLRKVTATTINVFLSFGNNKKFDLAQ